MVKRLPAVWETWVQFLGREDPLEEGMATHSGFLVWRIPMDREAWQATVHGITKSQTRQKLSAAHTTEDVRVLILPRVETQHLMLFIRN